MCRQMDDGGAMDKRSDQNVPTVDNLAVSLLVLAGIIFVLMVATNNRGWGVLFAFAAAGKAIQWYGSV